MKKTSIISLIILTFLSFFFASFSNADIDKQPLLKEAGQDNVINLENLPVVVREKITQHLRQAEYELTNARSPLLNLAPALLVFDSMKNLIDMRWVGSLLKERRGRQKFPSENMGKKLGLFVPVPFARRKKDFDWKTDELLRIL